MTRQDAFLLLEDGTLFKGLAAGKIGTTTGEICFNTGMTGYQEIFTDPSYFGQLLVMTNVHIGNYGTTQAETESDSIKIGGMICRNYNDRQFRQQADQSIEDYFQENNLVAISNVDTRAIVRHIRSKGAMNAIISSEILDVEKLTEMLKEVPSMDGLELASKVSTDGAYFMGDENAPIRVAVLDYGVKKNILKCMMDRGCYLKVFPAKSTYEDMKSFEANGYFLSNGPGDPAAMDYAVDMVKELLEMDKPIFGICLGHQLLARAAGIKTYKLHHGHRGINHPVQNLKSGLCEITSQNHGFGVALEDVKKFSDTVDITHMNLNDGTVEGIRIKNKKAFSVQYHPESSPGPHDSRYLFDEFVESLKSVKITA